MPQLRKETNMGNGQLHLEQLKSENERLTQLVDTFMSGYVGLFTANLRSGKIEFQKITKSLLGHFGIPGEIPVWEDFVSLYVHNAVLYAGDAVPDRVPVGDLSAGFLLSQTTWRGAAAVQYPVLQN